MILMQHSVLTLTDVFDVFDAVHCFFEPLFEGAVHFSELLILKCSIADQRTTAAQDEGEWRRTAEQGAERFMTKWIAAEKARAGIRHAVV